MATSVPQFNIREVNAALIKLIKDPNVSFDEIYCAPDFATGGTITNANEVKESLRHGGGKSVRMRATLKYNPAENMIQATELPYSVFTNTVIDQLAELTQNDPEYGIDKVIDHTKKTADIRIYLSKGVNPQKMIAKLYHDTSLEYWFSINMVLLDQGRFPKVFGWREACDAYIAHIRECKRNIIQFDLDKALARENIIEGLLLAIANIDDIVAIIKASDNPAAAKKTLIAKYNFNELQVDAILAMKLSSLCRLDGVKLNEELEEKRMFIADCRYLLNEPTALDEKLIETLNLVSQKFGDARRTKVENTLDEEEEPEVIEEKDIVITIRGNKLMAVEPNDKRARTNDIIRSTTTGTILGFSKNGKLYSAFTSKMKLGKDYVYNEVFDCGADKIISVVDSYSFNQYDSVTFVTEKGMIKRSKVSEYLTRSKKGVAAIKLEENDKVFAAICCVGNEKFVIVSNNNYYNSYPIDIITPTGRNTKGVKAIKLDEKEYVEMVITTTQDDIKYKNTGRAVKGAKYA